MALKELQSSSRIFASRSILILYINVVLLVLI